MVQILTSKTHRAPVKQARADRAEPQQSGALNTTTTPRRRRILWKNVLTVVSAAILIGAEVFGATFAGSWAIAIADDSTGWPDGAVQCR
jgi:hypothetical protein